MKTKIESLASDMNLATVAIMEAKEGLFGIIKVNNEHDDRIGHLTENLAYGGEQLCKVIGEKVEVLFAAIPEIKELAEQKSLTAEVAESLNNVMKKIDHRELERLDLKLARLTAICDVGSADPDFGNMSSERVGTLFYLLLDLAIGCRNHLDNVMGIEKEVA